MTIGNRLQKAAVFTDIHVGDRSNSEQHNEDCLNFVNWFCDQAVKNGCDHIKFLGDWFHHRNQINVSTIHYSYLIAKRLNDVGIPVYFLVGNHDLYQKHDRSIYSTIHFNEFDNFIVISEPTIVHEITGSPLLCPFLFHDEFSTLAQYNTTEIWWGHFEISGFVVTGAGNRMVGGLDPDLLTAPRFVFSGHFHKRQYFRNIHYVGNPFPTNYGDINDYERGMMTFDYTTNTQQYINWEDCPKFTSTSLSDISNGVELPINARVTCITDLDLTYAETIDLKQALISQYQLRELRFVDIDCEYGFEEGDVDVDADDVISGDVIESDRITTTIDSTIVQLLLDMPSSESIDNSMLVEIYQSL
jgi:DNA repair exonuclease SbcCD nuclease subunit